MEDQLRRNTLLFGSGVRLTKTPDGVITSFPNTSANKTGAFQVKFTPGGGAVTGGVSGNVAGLASVGLGLVQTQTMVIEPVIVQDGKAIPISGGQYDFSNLINAQSGAADIARAASLIVPPPKIPVYAADRDTENDWSFIALEITPDPATGLLTTEGGAKVSDRAVQCVHVGKLVNSAATGYRAIAALFWSGDHVVRVIQGLQFNVSYFRTSPQAGQGAPHHFIY